MRSGFFRSRAVLWIAGTAALLLTIVVCGLGLREATHQYRRVEDAILSSQRELARETGPRLATELREKARARLDRLESAMASGETPGSDAIGREFVVGRRGAELVGARRREPGTTMVDLSALRSAGSLRPALTIDDPAQRTDTLRAVARSGAEPEARWRAEALRADSLRRSGDTDAAVTLYSTLVSRAASPERETFVPSLVQLSLAFSAVLIDAGRDDEASEVLVRAIDRLETGATVTTRSEEAYFLRRVAALSPSHAELLEKAARRRDVLAREALAQRAAELVRAELSSAGNRETRALFDPTLGFVFWRPYRDAGRANVAALAISSAATEVASSAEELLDARHLAARYGVRPRVDRDETSTALDHTDDAPGVALATLAPPFEALELYLDAGEVERLVGDARRPFIHAGILIGGLALGLVCCLGVLLAVARREAQLARMKSEFVANVSHELKTPLALIRMFAETLLLRRLSDDGQRDKYYRIITRESERLSHLVANVLNFSSIEAGRKSYEFAVIDLGAVVRDVAESYQYRLDEKGFEHEVEIAADLPSVRADADAVRQAVINLVENAIKYSRESRFVRVEVERSKRAVEIRVSDRGVGISAEERARVWEDYYRSRSARALGTRGSGLGLSVVHHIVKAHGGSVDIQSEPERGSTFTLEFPVDDSLDSTATAAPPN